MIDFKEFEDVVKGIDKELYHINRTLKFSEDGNAYIADWNIFRKNMSLIEYFSPNNLTVLSSAKGNTIEDIKKFIEGGKNELI